MTQSNKLKEPIKVEVDDTPITIQHGKNESPDSENWKKQVYSCEDE